MVKAEQDKLREYPSGSPTNVKEALDPLANFLYNAATDLKGNVSSPMASRINSAYPAENTTFKDILQGTAKDKIGRPFGTDLYATALIGAEDVGDLLLDVATLKILRNTAGSAVVGGTSFAEATQASVNVVLAKIGLNSKAALGAVPNILKPFVRVGTSIPVGGFGESVETILTNVGEQKSGLDVGLLDGAAADGLVGMVGSGTASSSIETAGAVKTIAQAGLTVEDKDNWIRTIIGEAAGEDSEGRAAVGHVILNRLKDGGYRVII